MPTPRDGTSPSFKGKGLIRCLACGEPTRDHRIGPCESLGVDLIHSAPLRSESRDAVKARRRRDRQQLKTE